jgi:16S rRNA (adenine1518-N6/adenine1519-N6)-dimethyltransferase
MDSCDIKALKALLEKYGLRLSKSMGQNFLVAPWVPKRIAAASGADKSCGGLEIGPAQAPDVRALQNQTADGCRRGA